MKLTEQRRRIRDSDWIYPNRLIKKFVRHKKILSKKDKTQSWVELEKIKIKNIPIKPKLDKQHQIKKFAEKFFGDENYEIKALPIKQPPRQYI